MAEPEIHYLTYDPDEIWREMQVAYVEAGGEPLYPGDEKEMLLRSVQADLVQVFAGVDNALRMNTLRYATGDYLDLIGENRGCPRNTGDHARAMIRTHVYPWEYSTPYTLPAGSVFRTADGSVEFKTDVVAKLTRDYSTVPVTATKGGTYANDIPASTALVAVGTKAHCPTLSTTTSGGTDNETDDDYRERIRTFMLGNVNTATKAQLEYAVKDYNAVIKDAHAVRASATTLTPTVYITVDRNSYASRASYAASAQSVINANDSLPIGMSVTVTAATSKTAALKLVVVKGTVSQEEIQGIVDNYIDWQEYTIGRPFNPERVIGDLYNAGVTSVTATVTGAYTKVERTTIAENEHTHLTVTLTVS